MAAVQLFGRSRTRTPDIALGLADSHCAESGWQPSRLGLDRTEQSRSCASYLKQTPSQNADLPSPLCQMPFRGHGQTRMPVELERSANTSGLNNPEFMLNLQVWWRKGPAEYSQPILDVRL